MKNTVEEIILKIESAQRWNQYQGKRGRFVKGNPGRGWTEEEKSELENAIKRSVNNLCQDLKSDKSIKHIDSISRVNFIISIMKIPELRDRPDYLIEILKTIIK